MISVKTESQRPNGKVRRRYEVTVTDLQGNEHTEIIGMFSHEPSNDGSQVEQEFLENKKTQEKEFYIAEITAGKNPFTLYSLKWNQRQEMLKHVLDLALSLPASDTYVMNGLPYMQYVTDNELIALYSKNQKWVDYVRTKINELLESKAIVDDYQPVLEL